MRAPKVTTGATLSRRALLTGCGALAAGSAVGYFKGFPGLRDASAADALAFSIKTVPADEDELAIRIARHLAKNLQAVGVDAAVVLKPTKELRQDVLRMDAFDMYVDRLPLSPDPDFLRSLLHSESRGRVGWHNPFGFAEPTIDTLLDRQRKRSGPERWKTVARLLRQIAHKQPFVAVAVPQDLAAVRTNQFTNWEGAPIHSPLRYLNLRKIRGKPTDRLDIGVIDERITRNLNPVSAQYRGTGTVTGLLYDPLGRRLQGELRPWLAREWTWLEGESTRLEVTLRPDLEWHDGESVTAEDVEFTYQFLEDTSLGRADVSVPAPRLHDRASLVERVETRDRTTFELEFGETPISVAERALTAPILPMHVWEHRATVKESTPGAVSDSLTEALAWPNLEPIGSGPLRLHRRTVAQSLVLERFENHFLHRSVEDEELLSGLEYNELHFQVLPSPAAAVELAQNGDIDGTFALKDPGIVSQIGTAAPLSLSVNRAPVLYHVGFNTRRDPFGDTDVRRTIARLLDKSYIVDAIFERFANPVATPYGGTPWTPADLVWESGDPEVPFLGSDGELDTEKVRSQFRSSGYEYEGGKVVRG